MKLNGPTLEMLRLRAKQEFSDTQRSRAKTVNDIRERLKAVPGELVDQWVAVIAQEQIDRAKLISEFLIDLDTYAALIEQGD